MCPNTSPTSHVGDVSAIPPATPTADQFLAPKTQQSILIDNADLAEGLKSTPFKKIPVRFLYDDIGSNLYEQITQLEEYYPYKAEQHILHTQSNSIISHIPPDSVIVELGCGDGSKTSILLNALAARDGPAAVHFLGIDVSSGALAQAHRNLNTHCPSIPDAQLEFVAAEYMAGMREARRRHPDATLCVLWLGSSVGNFAPPEAAAFLADMRAAAGARCALLLCCDLWKDAATLHAAYDDGQGVTRAFIQNGMRHALRTLGHPAAALDGMFQYEALVNPNGRQVEMWLTATAAVNNVLPGVDIAAGERILMEISRKFTPGDIAGLAQAGGFCLTAAWRTPQYAVQLLLPPEEALTRCWADTDCLFARIEDWGGQPIELRHPFLFYYGHVASFLRLKVVAPSPPSAFDVMMSRGIDPNVVDPTLCHSHPEVPDMWPTRNEVEEYVAQVREEAVAHISQHSEAGTLDMHALLMSLEHERMHQETLTYMLAQHRKRQFNASMVAEGGDRPSLVHITGTSSDDESATAAYRAFYSQCSYWQADAGNTLPMPVAGNGDASSAADGQESFVTVPAGVVMLGVDTAEPTGFVWDNELGASGPIAVAEATVATHPVTVAEFRQFVLHDKGYSRRELWGDGSALTPEGTFVSTRQAAPSTWTVTPGGDVYVHMPEGTYHWTEVAGRPVYVSLAEARAYASLHGGRVMSEAEYEHFVRRKDGGCPAAGRIAALETEGWEWTDTALSGFEGFSPDALYSEYSLDFFDGQHFVLKGSCPYTHPSMRRRSFRNFYQLLYGHMFAKFRVVRTVD